MKTENSTDKFFRDKLRNHGKTPSASAWEALEKTLDQETKPKGFRYKKAVYGLAIFLMMSSGATWYFYDSGEVTTNTSVVLNDNDSLKNTKKNVAQNTSNQEDTDLEENLTSDAQQMDALARVEHTDTHTNSEEREYKSAELSTSKSKSLGKTNTQKSNKTIDSKDTQNQLTKSEMTVESSSNSKQVEEEKVVEIQHTSKKQVIAPKKESKKSQKVEIIIKMGNEGGYRQTSRDEKISEMFPKADSLEKAQKKPSRFGRVLKQMKNFKNGEKVDLNQLKKNPNGDN